MLPLDTFNYPESEWQTYPTPPWKQTGEIPHDWFKNNVAKFIYQVSHIIKEAVPYALNERPFASGIYFLFYEKEIIYVGQSGDIRNRMNQHWEKEWDIQYYWCFGGIPKFYIEDVEAYYIHLIEPPLNIKYPILHEFVKPLVKSAKNGTLKYVNT